MPTPNPEHLLEQAERLVQPPAAGPPRQADVRRAISAAYYAVFHALLTAAADEYIGKTKRGTTEYALAYRSINHGWVKTLCQAVASGSLSGKLGSLAPRGGYGTNLPATATAVLELQERRHEADYDPLLRVKTADAVLAVRTARSAIRRLNKAPSSKKKRFLALLLFQPR
ncbi:hypothetical protein ACETK8_08500 [Brevundimonas staleyi]|uniref:HEPN domain-containing protein n=1 Tax=Brevundimonas staleyi TaxID=74326 RepID=A0ABW0FV75_9CAUL